jgi:hypothetical protein
MKKVSDQFDFQMLHLRRKRPRWKMGGRGGEANARMDAVPELQVSI